MEIQHNFKSYAGPIVALFFFFLNIFSILCTSKHVHLYNSSINKASCHKWSIDDNKLHLPCFSLEMLHWYLHFY